MEVLFMPVRCNDCVDSRFVDVGRDHLPKPVQEMAQSKLELERDGPGPSGPLAHTK